MGGNGLTPVRTGCRSKAYQLAIQLSQSAWLTTGLSTWLTAALTAVGKAGAEAVEGAVAFIGEKLAARARGGRASSIDPS